MSSLGIQSSLSQSLGPLGGILQHRNLSTAHLGILHFCPQLLRFWSARAVVVLVDFPRSHPRFTGATHAICFLQATNQPWSASTCDLLPSPQEVKQNSSEQLSLCTRVSRPPTLKV